MYLDEWRHFRRQFFLALRRLFFLVVFLICLHFCLLSHFEVIRYFVTSFIAISTYFLMKYNRKKNTSKLVFGRSGLGTQTGIFHWKMLWGPYRTHCKVLQNDAKIYCSQLSCYSTAGAEKGKNVCRNFHQLAAIWAQTYSKSTIKMLE